MTNPKTPLPLFDKIYEMYHKDAGKMLRHTGTIAWILSSVAQLFGIAANDKIPKEQKMYMIPQEIADAVKKIRGFIPKENIWINPDCGLKTRGEKETVESLKNLVTAARQVRAAV